MKTYAEWNASGLASFEEYCNPGDEVDEAIVEHFRKPAPPLTIKPGLVQCSEAYGREPTDDGYRITFTTFHRDADKWVYCGKCFVGQTENRTNAREA